MIIQTPWAVLIAGSNAVGLSHSSNADVPYFLLKESLDSKAVKTGKLFLTWRQKRMGRRQEQDLKKLRRPVSKE